MSETSELISMARKASGLTLADAASICGITIPTYLDREKDYRTWRIGELEALYENMHDVPRSIIRDALIEIFFSNKLH